MILKNYGEALQQQLQEQAELQLQLQQHLEQEIYPWLAWVSKKILLGSKKIIRIKKKYQDKKIFPVIQLFSFQICRNFPGQLVQITWWLYESYGCWTKTSKVILGWDVIWDFLDPGWWLWCQEQQLQRELREQLEREIQVPWLKLVEVSTQDSFLKTFRCRIFWVEKKIEMVQFFFGGSDTFRKMDKQITTFGTSSYWWSQRPSTHRPKCRGRGVEPKPNPGLQSFGGIGV